MQTKLHVALNLPEGIELSEKDAAMIIAVKLWVEGLLSYGQASEMAGISKKEFIESLGKYGFSFTNISAEDLQQEMTNVSNYNI